MALSSRSRSVVLTAPVFVTLVAFTVVALVRPAAIDPGPPRAVLVAAVLLAGTVTAAAVGWATVRARPGDRLDWAGIGVAGLFSTASVLGYLLGAPGWLVWGVLRGLATLCIAAVCVRLYRTYTTKSRDWAVMMLDGWLVAVSVFMIAWACVSWSGSPLSSSPTPDHPALLLLPADLLIASVTAGRAMRTHADVRTPVLLLVLVTLLFGVVDTVWALTGVPQFGAWLWVVQALAVAAAALTGPLDLWAADSPPEAFPPLLRLPQWAVVPGLMVAVVPSGDHVVAVAAASVVLGLGAELALSGRQNHRLWRTLRAQAQRLDRLLSESRDAIVHVDARGYVRFANDATADVIGSAPPELLGRSGLSLVHPADRARLVAEVTRLGEGDAGGRVSGRFKHADGTWRSLEATISRRTGGEAGYTLSARDVSERVSLENELRRLAGTDALTALLNRPAFLSLLESRLREGPVTVLFVDLDGFKAVNDLDGHAAGDRLLREVAETLRRELRGPDVAARLGGDEFAVLLGTDHPGEVRAVADRLVQRLRRMPSDPGRRTAASIGVATSRDASAETLLGDADLAMYEAKARGGRRHVVFEPWMRERVTERVRMSSALERACAGEGLLLDVQPIVSLVDRRWVGFEALARWLDDGRRREPGEFLPVAEESGLIDPLGRWVLHRTLTWLARWPDRSAGVSVNVAGSQLVTAGFGDWVHQQLAGCGIAPQRLTLEISERTALGDLQRATAVLQPLRALGVRVALDDFGTGFSSLGHLAELPVDELKIDRSFVAGIGRRAQDDALVRAVCRLAGDLGLRVVAEGVESPHQELMLLEHGCQYAQGYLFERPTSIADLAPPAARRPAPPAPRVVVRPADPRTRAS